MWDYRETMSKRECLITAMIWTIIPFLWLLPAVLWLKVGYWWGFALVGINALASVFHWRRYLRYDRKQKGGTSDENG